MTTNNDQPAMSGKICLVTGATAGIGLVTARELARQGATVLLVGRNAHKGADTVKQIREQTSNPELDFLQADLSVQQDIRRLALQVQQQQRLDVLVNNAGALFLQRQESADGIEMTFALNHLNYFLLTSLLLDLLKASAPARIVNVSSAAHEGASINFDDLEGKHRYQGGKAYGQSKLANLLFTYELARRLEGTGVTVNALHPGLVASNFGMNNGWLAQLFKPLVKLVGKSPERGAQTSIYLASSPEVAGVSGKYFVDKQETRSAPASYDVEAARRLWQVSEEMTELHVAA